MKYRGRLIAFLIFYASLGAFAQTDTALLGDLAADNKEAVEALVLYPSETRLSILEATQYPEVLIKMQNMREKTSAAFQTLIEDFPQSTQAVFYDISRYPGMVELLVSHKNEPAKLREALEAMPEEKRDETYGVVSRQIPTLLKISDLNQTTRRAFDRLIDGYSEPAQLAFEQLLVLPEVIDLLNEDLRFTILVGETYRNNPAWVIYKTDSLNLAVARAHAAELGEWSAALDKDPDAKAEFELAAREYATENGINTTEYYSDAPYPDVSDITIFHYDEPYPYWFGYPWWEPYPRWRPYPWWYDWGCHFYPGEVVIVYLPSYHFTHWYFEHPQHHVHYKHLSAHFVHHYYGHRNSGTTISMGVREWRERNRSIISEGFIADKGRLPERLKEYGRFEENRKAFNEKHPKAAVNQEDFLKINVRKYPELKHSKDAADSELTRAEQVKRDKRARWAPSKAPANPEPAIQPSKPAPRPRPERPAAVPKAPPGRQPDAAKEYNRQKWEEKKTPPAPKPSSEPKKMKTNPPAPKNKGRGN